MPSPYRPYGTWHSPITPLLLSDAVRLSDVQWASADTLVWLESRGKTTRLVAQTGSAAPRELNDLNVRGGVGYGGGDFHAANGSVVFVASGSRLYHQTIAAAPTRPHAITPTWGKLAAPRLSPDGQWVVFVYSDEDGRDGLALADSAGRLLPRRLADGTDFVMQPVWHPRGDRLAYVVWDHPNMPWDGTELRLASLTTSHDGVPSAAVIETIAGGATTAIFQPEFSPDGETLSYVSDASGWGQIMLYTLRTGEQRQLTHAEAEHGAPAWVQGTRQYGWTPDSSAVYAVRNTRGFFALHRITLASGKDRPVHEFDAYTHVHQVSAHPTHDLVAALASSSTLPERIVVSLDWNAMLVKEQEQTDMTGAYVAGVRRYSLRQPLASADAPSAEAVAWTAEDGETAHGLFYAPVTAGRTVGASAPPLIVYVHGGPTSQARALYSPFAQFYASRGFAVLEVNHRGGTGYGRAYMDRLRGAWGVYDVRDSVGGARWLADTGRVHPTKRAIYGGSAGGFTVLQTLIEQPGFFTCGVCLYGVANQFTLMYNAQFKFESQYSLSLLGALPDAEAYWREKSPQFHAERIRDPLLIFQGDEDTVVPPEQSEGIVAALRAQGTPHEYIVYEGEGHGFRKPETLADLYARVVAFFQRWLVYG